jgi:uncharacterized delta-60 repeat protein
MHGCHTKICVYRFLPSGRLDEEFGGSGKVVYTGASRTNASGVGVTRENKIVVGGTCYTSPEYLMLTVRFNEDGSLDSSYGEEGACATAVTSSESSEFCEGFLLDTKGRSLLIGMEYMQESSNRDIIIARHTEEGVLDESFRDNENILFDDTGIASIHTRMMTHFCLASHRRVQSGKGKTRVPPWYQPPGSSSRKVGPASLRGSGGRRRVIRILDQTRYLVAPSISQSDEFIGETIICQLLEDGSFDPSFGSEGMVQIHVPNMGGNLLIAIMRDSREGLYRIMNANDLSSGTEYYIFRLDSEGQLLTDYGNN